MPKRTDLHKILIIGSGPIVIGQGCEFDYSGVQACKALKGAGYEIVLVNSNPATIMTDPEMADHTYIEAITWQSVARIIAIERPQALLSTMGGQTALNCALELDKQGILSKYSVELIGANKLAIQKAEDRQLFGAAMYKLGLDMAKSFVATTMHEAQQVLTELNFPVIIRPSYTLGGSGGGVAYTQAEYTAICENGLSLSMNNQLLIEESLLGWKEYELEVIRDSNDSCIIVCTIENIDPMGIHTGDSITVAPAQTLTDVEYQRMRDAAMAILREIGVETGGSNVQFAIEPSTGRMIVIEMNPRVSRSSALASKATGFPIAKVAALLAVGYTLDELSNDITGGIIPAAFEPTLDYVVVKIPRFNFEKFPQVTPRLTTQMHAIGEVMAIGDTFAVAMQKALCSLDIDVDGFDSQISLKDPAAKKIICHELQFVGPLRILYVADAIRIGMSLEDIYSLTGIDPWFLDQIVQIIKIENQIAQQKISNLSALQLLTWKRVGFSDRRLAKLLNCAELDINQLRLKFNLKPKYKRIDSCAAEFPASSAYLYSTYIGECEANVSNAKKVIVLGSGPNRIGQGIEFDYSCVQAVKALQEADIEAIMINCNPETVSTDYDISDRLYFEALNFESVLDIIRLEQPLGVILQLGGQTPLKLAYALHNQGVTILGSSPDVIDMAEDRKIFTQVVCDLKLLQPANLTATSVAQGLAAAQQLQYPLILRPSYVLGGRSMRVVRSDAELTEYLLAAFAQNDIATVLIDSFLEGAIEVDVDLIADGQGGVLISGVMQHIEPAGVHSGDSACCLPPHTLNASIVSQIEQQARSLAKHLQIVGLMNIQFAVKDNIIYIIEANPRASRTVPFVSKSTGCPVIKIAVNCMLGQSLAQQNLSEPVTHNLYAIKQAIFPFHKFLGSDPILGPEMRSTGEVMSFGRTFNEAYAKSLVSADRHKLTSESNIYVSVNEHEIEITIPLVRKLCKNNRTIFCDELIGAKLKLININCEILSYTQIIDLLQSNQIDLILSTVISSEASNVRIQAIRNRVLCNTDLVSTQALVDCVGQDCIKVYKLQDLHVTQIIA